MNTKILQKCLDELNKQPFKIDKVIGMLETMIEMSGETPIVTLRQPFSSSTEVYAEPVLVKDNVDEKIDEIAELYTGGRIAPLQ